MLTVEQMEKSLQEKEYLITQMNRSAWTALSLAIDALTEIQQGTAPSWITPERNAEITLRHINEVLDAAKKAGEDNQCEKDRQVTG
jgi:hypothetical protein